MKRDAGVFPPVISVDRKAAHPLQRQIYDAFRRTIVDRNLRPGQQIPSSRALALELGISRIPVLNAYARLLAEGYFESRVGAGTFVSSSLPEESFPGKRRALAKRADGRPPRIRSAASRLPRYERQAWVSGQGAFNVSQPALDAFPVKTWSTIASRHLRNPLVSHLQYGDPMGLKELREAIASYLRISRVVRCEPQQIMIVSGSQQALDLCARVLLCEEDSVWLEEPAYWLARHVLNAAKCRVAPIRVDGEGPDVAEGMRRCTNARAAFVAPSHQFPLGVTMSASRRLQLLDWARRSGAWIVEDDYDSEYRYDGRPVASLQGLDHSSRVIYIGTFSKVLFPSLRVGYIVIPAELVDYFVAMRHAMDVSPPHLIQAVLAEFIGDGHFSRHIRRMRALYSERRKALVDLLAEEAGSLLEVIGDEAGMHVTALLREGLQDRDVAAHAARENLWLWPLSPAYATKRARQGLILGFGNTTVAQMPKAVRHLRAILYETQRIQGGAPRGDIVSTT